MPPMDDNLPWPVPYPAGILIHLARTLSGRLGYYVMGTPPRGQIVACERLGDRTRVSLDFGPDEPGTWTLGTTKAVLPAWSSEEWGGRIAFNWEEVTRWAEEWAEEGR